MPNLFDPTRSYSADDPEIVALLGGRARQAQMRYHRRAPAFYRLGRRIFYHGVDLNAWAEARRVDPNGEV